MFFILNYFYFTVQGSIWTQLFSLIEFLVVWLTHIDLNVVWFQLMPCQHLMAFLLFNWCCWFHILPGLSPSENTEVDPDKLNARLEVLSGFLTIQFLICFMCFSNCSFFLHFHRHSTVSCSYVGFYGSALQYIVMCRVLMLTLLIILFPLCIWF